MDGRCGVIGGTGMDCGWTARSGLWHPVLSVQESGGLSLSITDRKTVEYLRPLSPSSFHVLRNRSRSVVLAPWANRGQTCSAHSRLNSRTNGIFFLQRHDGSRGTHSLDVSRSSISVPPLHPL